MHSQCKTSTAPDETSEEVPGDSEDPDGSHGTGGFEVAASVVRAVVMDNVTMSGRCNCFD